MTTTAQAAARRSVIAAYVNFQLDGKDSNYDVDGLVAELDKMTDMDYRDMTDAEFWTIAGRHEEDEDGMTDAKMAAALAATPVTGWVVLMRTAGGEVEMFELHNTSLATEQAVRDHLAKFLASETRVQILPLVG